MNYDEGKTKTAGKNIFSGSSAYSSMTILKNGDIGLLFEKDNYTENVFASVSSIWLTDRKHKYRKPKKLKIQLFYNQSKINKINLAKYKCNQDKIGFLNSLIDSFLILLR